MSADADTPQTESAGIQFAGPDDARLVFSGPPQRLTGTIPLINTSADKQKLRSLEVSADVLQGPAQLPLREVPFLVKLSPGQQAAASGVITLDRGTRPGSYQIELKIGDRSVPATAHVSEVVDFQIDPTQVTILGEPGKTYTRKFFFQNKGNTDLPTGARCEAPVFRSLSLLANLLTGLHKADKSSAEEMVKGFLNEWSTMQVGTMVITREPITLAPGDKVEVDVDFQLPAELEPLNHYAALLQLYNAVLAVDIYTTAETKTPPVAKAPTRRKNNA